MSNRTRSIDENLAEFIDRRSKSVLDYCAKCRSGKEVSSHEPFDLKAHWKSSRDLALMYQGTMLVLQGVIGITGVIPDLELSRKAYNEVAELVPWIERNKLRKATHARTKRKRSKT